MGNMYSAEVYKLKYNKSFLFCLFIIVLSAAVTVYLMGNSDVQERIMTFSGMLPMFLALSISVVACDDFDRKTMKNILSSGNGKGGIYSGKLLAALTVCVIYFLVDGIATVLFAGIKNGMGGTYNIGNMIASIGLQLLMMLLYTLYFYPIALVTKSSKTGFIACILFDIFFDTLLMYAAQIAKLGDIRPYTMSTLAQNIEELNITGRMPINFAIYTGLAVIINVLAYMRFKRVEE